MKSTEDDASVPGIKLDSVVITGNVHELLVARSLVCDALAIELKDVVFQ